MNTLLLKYVLEVEKSKSISQAAENLFMAQPNLSKAIRELEEALNITIFSRTSKGVIPTKKGVEFLGYAKNVMKQIEKMEALGTDENSKKQEFRVSIPRGSYISDGVIRMVKELKMDESVEISIKETNSLEAVNDLLIGISDLGIVRYKTKYENYFLDYLEEKKMNHDLVWEFDYLVLMSKRHPLANAEQVTQADLDQYIEITHADMEVPFVQNRQEQFREQGVNKRIYVYERFNQFELLSQVDATYMWVSPIPSRVLDRYHLVQRKCLCPEDRIRDELIYPKDFQMSAIYKKFIDKLYQSRNEVAYNTYR